MRLLDAVETWDETSIRCRTATHRASAHPLRYRGQLSVSVGLEYAAQAMGVHVGLLHRDREAARRIGYVGSVRDVIFDAERLDDTDADLIVEATRLAEGDQSYMYRFTLLLDNRTIVAGRASIFIKAAS
ncbi:MAG: 3-hydroxydecanoyl-(acyl-carrier-protein) dehydratase, inferred for ABFAE pathway [Nitrospira sp.]|nr:MAG: 3-hydroxydecanoyl-(acyl-carrier-protein) dehydratase, inferred for ABFAE pathway [Nitrospira sp.]